MILKCLCEFRILIKHFLEYHRDNELNGFLIEFFYENQNKYNPLMRFVSVEDVSKHADQLFFFSLCLKI